MPKGAADFVEACKKGRHADHPQLQEWAKVQLVALARAIGENVAPQQAYTVYHVTSAASKAYYTLVRSLGTSLPVKQEHHHYCSVL